MIDIALQSIPNQTLSIRVDDSYYELTLKSIGNLMVASVKRDNVALFDGLRVMPNRALMPYQYQEAGNFVLITDGEYPDYTQFGVTQSLVYLTIAEVKSARA